MKILSAEDGLDALLSLKEADMPGPIRDLPLSRELLEQGRQEGERAAALRFARRMLLRRFGADPRIDAVAARLAELPEDRWIARIDDATTLDDLSLDPPGKVGC